MTDLLVCITTTGGKLTQSNIASSLTAALVKRGYYKIVTCTKLRKSATTLVYTTNPERVNTVASHNLCVTGRLHSLFDYKDSIAEYELEPESQEENIVFTVVNHMLHLLMVLLHFLLTMKSFFCCLATSKYKVNFLLQNLMTWLLL